MKKLLAVLALAAMAVPSRATVAGRLMLTDPTVDVIVFREMNDGMWLGGAQKSIWGLYSINHKAADGSAAPDIEVMHAAVFWASRPELNSHTAYGPSLGVNIGGLAHSLALQVAGIAELVYACPPWVGKVGNWTSLDVYGGYRPVIGSDEHHWAYGVGGKITIPLGTTWQQFVSKAQGGGL